MARLDAEAAAAVVRSVADADGGRGARLPRGAAETVGEDLGRRPPRDRRGGLRADRRPGGDRLHVHADRPREGPRMGCGLRGRRRIRLEWSVWSGREDLNRRFPHRASSCRTGSAAHFARPRRVDRRASARSRAWAPQSALCQFSTRPQVSMERPAPPAARPNAMTNARSDCSRRASWPWKRDPPPYRKVTMAI